MAAQDRRRPALRHPPPPRRAVVTGGAGFLGSWICASLLQRGMEVVCVDNLLTGSPDNIREPSAHDGFTFVHGDVCDELDVAGPVDWVLHLASPASPVHYLSHGIETLRAGSCGTFNVLELARRKGARFVLASTSEVYGDPLQHPQTESYWGNVNPVGPRSVYDEAKRFAEALTTAYRTAGHVDTGIVRIFNTYGPRMRCDDGRVIPAFVTQALAGEPMTVAGDGSQTRSVCYVTDLVRGVLAMASSEEAGPVNLGHPGEVTVLDLARRIRAMTGSTSEIVHVDLPQDDPRVRCPDVTLARERLGWAPQVDRSEGLRQTIEWFRSVSLSVPAVSLAGSAPSP